MPSNCCEKPGFWAKFVGKPEISPETEFLAPGLGKSNRCGESVVMCIIQGELRLWVAKKLSTALEIKRDAPHKS